MRKSISEWSFLPNLSMEERMRLARDAGFEGIEIALNEDTDGSQKELGLLCLDSTDEQIAEIVALAESVGIEIASVACGLYWKYSLTSDSEEDVKKAYQVTETLLRSAQKVGVDGCLVIPGCVYSSFAGLDPVPYDVCYQRALKAIRDLAPIAEETGVKMGLEYVWNGFLLSPLEFARFIEEVGSEYVGIYLDTGNMIATGLAEDWIRILGRRIVRVHFKDFKRSVGTLEGFCDLLEGDVNWPQVMKAFAEVGYDGWATAEMMPPYKHAPEQLLYQTSRAMDIILRM